MAKIQSFELTFDESKAQVLQQIAVRSFIFRLLIPQITPSIKAIKMYNSGRRAFDLAIAEYASQGYVIDGGFEMGRIYDGRRLQSINERREFGHDDFRFVVASAWGEFLGLRASFNAYRTELAREPRELSPNRSLLHSFEGANKLEAKQEYIIIAPAVFAAVGEFSSCLVPAIIEPVE